MTAMNERGGLWFGGPGVQPVQTIPVNLYETADELVVVAPMPGLEPTDIVIDITAEALTLYGELRGIGQERRQYIAREWSYGPYLRTVRLPVPVDSARLNATYSNGVLTVALPKGARTHPTKVRLAPVHGLRGLYIGHRGWVGRPRPPELSRHCAGEQ